MPLFDLPLPELEQYVPERDEPEDFDAFWSQTLAETRLHPLDARFERWMRCCPASRRST